MRHAWPMVPLSEALTPVSRAEPVDPEKTYRMLGAHWYAGGLFIKETLTGAEIQAARVYRVEEGDFVYNRLFAWKGSFAVASKRDHGCFVSNEFPCFRVRSNEVDVRYVWRYFSREAVWAEALAFSKGATPTSRNRLKEDAYLAMQIPLPPLEEQQRIATRIDELATKVDEARALRRDISQAVDSLFISKLKDVIRKQGHHVRYVPFTDIAHLERRPVDVKLDARYREIGVYSFGKGIFLKPPRTGAEIGNKALIEIRAGDLILQLTFAWEGAVALAEPAHDGLFGSVRYLTFRVNETFCSPRYLLIFLRTAEGKAQLEKISPGSAGRNRVLSLKRLNEVLVPIPPLETQRWLTDDLQAQMDALNRLQTETAGEMDALLPSIIDRAFKGELWC